MIISIRSIGFSVGLVTSLVTGIVSSIGVMLTFVVPEKKKMILEVTQIQKFQLS